MRKTLFTAITVLILATLTGCAVTPAYSYYSPPRAGVYVTTPRYYTPAPYYSPWRHGYRYGHRHWH